MKWLLIFAILLSTISISRAAEESLGTKIKKGFEPSPTPSRKHRKKKTTPTPSPTSSGSRASGKKAWPNVSLSPDEIADYDSYPSKVRQILDAGLALTKQNLGYTYGSADPKNSGMDCSGFIYYVLKQNGFPDVPRDSSQQYVWVRKAGNFYAVLSRKEDSFEFD